MANRSMTDLAARLRLIPADTLTALAFFSRLPVRTAAGAFDLRRAAGAWPLAGLILALPPAVLLTLLRAVECPPFVSALAALALMAALTGGMHEDGLSDTADGLGGGRTRGEKLAIMHDSRLGTFGALALLFSVLIRAAALGSLSAAWSHAALALVSAAVVSRALALWHWHATLPARSDGLASAAGRPDWLALLIGLSFGLIGVAVLGSFGAASLIAMLAAAAAVALFSRLCRRQIGGHTGDTIGAAQQIAETALLAGLTLGLSPLVHPTGGD